MQDGPRYGRRLFITGGYLFLIIKRNINKEVQRLKKEFCGNKMFGNCQGNKENFECSQTAADKKERGGSRGDVLPP